MSQLPAILEIGHPTLRKTAQPVDPLDPALPDLIDRMINSVLEANGMGLAAPQIGESKRVVIVASRPNARYPHAPEMPLTALINPKITPLSDEIELGFEGCLSIPGIRGRVPRHAQIRLSYQQLGSNDWVHVDWSGFLARVAQHEIDHLDGLLWLDRIEDNREIVSEAQHFAADT